MHRLLILGVVVFLFVGGLLAPAFADEYCPAVTIAATQFCDCYIFNYGTKDDTNVTFTMYSNDILAKTCGPVTVKAGGVQVCEIGGFVGTCSCMITGDAKLSRTSLCVDQSDFTPLTCVPCK